MSFPLLEKSSKSTNRDGRKLQEKLDQYNKDFYDTIHFFPEAYGLYQINKEDSSYERIDQALSKNKSDMYQLYVTVNKHIRKGHESIENRDIGIDTLRVERDIMDTELELLVSQDIAASQRKIDKVEQYRMQVVETFYLLAGIGVIGGSIYHLIK